MKTGQFYILFVELLQGEIRCQRKKNRQENGDEYEKKASQKSTVWLNLLDKGWIKDVTLLFLNFISF